MKRYRLLFWCGWISFIVSLPLPGVMVDMGAWNHPSDTFIPGWFCMIVAWPFYPSNALMLLSPLLLLSNKWRLKPWTRFVVAFSFLASFAGAAAYLLLFPPRAIHAGYLLWVISFAIVGVSILLPRETASRLEDPEPR